MPIKEPTGLTVPLWLMGPARSACHPVRIGAPLPRGVLRREEMVRLVDAEGRLVPLQTEVLARWPDETIQWLLVDFWAQTTGPERETWQLQIGRTAGSAGVPPAYPLPTAGEGGPAQAGPGEGVWTEGGGPAAEPRPSGSGLQASGEVGSREWGVANGGQRAEARGQKGWIPACAGMTDRKPSIRLEEEGPTLWVDTGPVLFGLDQQRLRPIRWVRIQEAASSQVDLKTQRPNRFPSEPLAETETRLELPSGVVREAAIDGWRVESAGPVRLTLRTEGHFRRAKRLQVRARLSFFAGTGLVCYQLTVHNPRRARHRGGLWDLGDPGSVLFKDLSVWVRLAEPIQQAAVQIEPPGPVLNLTETLQQGVWRLYQDSSGGPNWQSPNHINRQGRVPCRLPGYEVSIISPGSAGVPPAYPLPTAGEGGLSSRPGEGGRERREVGSGDWRAEAEGREQKAEGGGQATEPRPSGSGHWTPPHPLPSATVRRGEDTPSPQPLSRGGERGEIADGTFLLPEAPSPGIAEGDAGVSHRGERQGGRAAPAAALQTEKVLLALAVPEFWQQFPKTLEIQRQGVRVGLWPAEWDDLHELQGGERKTHTLWLDFAPGQAAPANSPDSSEHPSEPIGPNQPSTPLETADPLTPAPLPRRGEGKVPPHPYPSPTEGRGELTPSRLANLPVGSSALPRGEGKGFPPSPSPSSTIGQDALTEAVDRLAWVHEPIQVVLPPEVWAAAEVLGHFSPAGHEGAARLDGVLAEAIDGPDSLLARREVIDEYGWRHYGELYADHENAHYPGPQPVISHYNNQFDVIYGAILQEARTGNPAWRALYDPLARHVMDIDLYHTQEDRPAYNGGLFWPTDHYRTAHTATHRTYSRQNQPPDGSPYGGGPGPEHNYAAGLLYYYYLTGNRDAREAVVQLADWVLQMDDGSQTPWGVLDPGPTGLASATRSADYHGPGRGSANSIQALLDAWQATGQRKYLSKAEELIRRTIHPADQIAERRLLDAENRWSYTMHLSALARYLEMKIQHEDLDAMYRYGQAALVHYGAWMAEHERPYLDHPEQLEYVTEAWPVQELRKANAMRLAARHAEEPLRSRLFARAAELADRAWNDWTSFPTRMSTRALAVLLVEGVRDAYYRVASDPPAPQIGGPKHFGHPEPFVPQRERVRSLLRQPAGWIRLVWALAKPGNWFRLIESLWRHRN